MSEEMLRGYLYFSEDGAGLKVTRDVASSPQSVVYKAESQYRIYCAGCPHLSFKSSPDSSGRRQTGPPVYV